MSTGIVIVTSAQFRPAHATLEMEQKLRKIGQMYWAIQLAEEELANRKTYLAAHTLQVLKKEREELIKTLPLYAVEGGMQ